jgi:hypothetical protein
MKFATAPAAVKAASIVVKFPPEEETVYTIYKFGTVVQAAVVVPVLVKTCPAPVGAAPAERTTSEPAVASCVARTALVTAVIVAVVRVLESKV